MPWTLKIFWKQPKRTYFCPNSLEESRWENNKITMFPGVFFGVSLGVLHFWLSACSSWAWLSAPRSLKAWRSGIGDLPGIPSDIRSTKGKTMDKLGIFLMLLGGDLTCFNHLMKNDGLRQLGWWNSHVLWKIKNVPNHQPVYYMDTICCTLRLWSQESYRLPPEMRHLSYRNRYWWSDWISQDLRVEDEHGHDMVSWMVLEWNLSLILEIPSGNLT